MTTFPTPGVWVRLPSGLFANVTGGGVWDPGSTPGPGPVPPQPSWTGAVGTDGAASLDWVDTTNTAGYRVYRNGTLIGTTATSQYLDSPLVNGTSYTYRVAAYNAAGESALSDPRTITPAASAFTRPTATNTGHRGALTTRSGFTVTTAGAIITGFDTGRITVDANNVTIRDCRTSAASTSPNVDVLAGRTGLTIEYVTFELTGGATVGGTGLRGRDFTTARWCKFTGHGDAVKAWNYSLYEYNHIRMAKPPGSAKHLDGIQGSGKTNWTARRNDIEVLYQDGGNFSMFCQAYTGSSDVAVRDVVIEENWLNGGNRALSLEDGKTGSGYLQGLVIRGNRFGRNGRYYPNIIHLEGDYTFTGNVWDDDDSPIGAS